MPRCSLTLNILKNAELNLLNCFNISFMLFGFFLGEKFYDMQRKKKSSFLSTHGTRTVVFLDFSLRGFFHSK